MAAQTAPADASPEAPHHAFHSLAPAAALRAARTTTEGLSSVEAAERLERHGPNRLPSPPPRHPLARFVSQFDNLLIYVLLGAAAISAALGHTVDALVIVAVVLINALVGYLQEGRAEQALEAIRAMIATNAAALRDGRRITLDAGELVRGDIVFLEPGERVPADCRLIRARNLRIDESILTGESMAVDKSTEPAATDAPLAERTSMAYSGTMVGAGQGLACVVAIGVHTELGRISRLIRRVERLETPLLRQMNHFARQLTVAIVALAAAVGVLAVTLRGYPWSEAFMVMVGLAVAAIPEGLPAVMTITLAIGVQRMAARNAIIRRLPAVETLGAVSVICSDKTGTLTRNEMTVRDVILAEQRFEITGAGYEPHGVVRCAGRDVDPAQYPLLQTLARCCLLCNDASLRQLASGWAIDGDPIEGAMVSLANKCGYETEVVRKQYPRTDEIPFDAQHRFMATLHHSHEHGAFVVVKGAPERLLELCDGQLGSQGASALDIDYWLREVQRLAANGERVLAVATKPMATGKQDLLFDDLAHGLLLLGVVGVLDPPREEAVAAITACREAGIDVKMITGDHPVTAAAIGDRLGLLGASRVATGPEIDGWSVEELRRRLPETAVFARTTPEHKLKLVTALQSEGAVVAMTGDGVNDAPALKRADVGIAMGGKGSEAAKQASEMVLADDNFASIVAAVREGRTVYDNLKKVIAWTLPTNGGEALVIILAVLLGFTLPITPVQILWVNMVTAVALGLSLAFEPTEAATMQRPPRPSSEPLLTGFLLWRIVFVSLLFVSGAFALFFWAAQRGLPLETARTLVVNTLVVMEIFYLFSVRYVHGTSLTWRGVLGTRAVLLSVGAVVIAQLAFTYWRPLQAVFASRALGWLEGVAAIGVGVGLLCVVEIEKRVQQWYVASSRARG